MSNLSSYFPLRKKVIFPFFVVASLVGFFSFVYAKGNVLTPLVKPKLICKDCNVILVSLDTLGAKHIPCYGYDRDTAPKLCAFAKENVIFANHYSNATWSLPSHVSIFSGLYSFHHGVTHAKTEKLQPDIPFLPDILQVDGYKTIFTLPVGNQSFPIEDVYYRGISDYLDEGPPYREKWQVGLDEFSKNVKQGQKSFLFLHTYYLHEPYLVGDQPLLYATKKYKLPLKEEELDYDGEGLGAYIIDQGKEDLKNLQQDSRSLKVKEVIDKLEKASSGAEKKAIIQADEEALYGYILAYTYRDLISLSDPDQIAYVQALYDQKIHQLDDDLIEQLTTYLKNNPEIAKKTIVLITSDHGEEFMEHGFWGHYTSYEPNIRTLFILSIPGQKAKTIYILTQSVDITPTILDILDMKSRPYTDGVSVLPMISDSRTDERLIITIGAENRSIALRWQEYKLHVSVDNGKILPYELYNVVQDPTEKENLLVEKYTVAEEILKKFQQLKNEKKR